jgi:hypothetical protein
LTAFVSFACNDERGNFTRKADAFDFEDHRGYSASLQGPGLVVDHLAHGESAGHLKVGRRHFEIAEYKAWVGNWCWDRVTLSHGEARRLLSYLLERGFDADAWDCEGPWAQLIETTRKLRAAQ